MKRSRYLNGGVICLIRYNNTWIWGYNDRSKTSPMWNKIYANGDSRSTRHAEEHALQLFSRATRNNNGVIKKVVVIRKLKDGKLGMAKPCIMCQEKLWRAGVNPRRIHYSNELGTFSTLKTYTFATPS